MSLATRIAQEFNTVRTEIGNIPESVSTSTSYTQVDGTNAISNTVLTKANANVTYTGQTAEAGVMVDNGDGTWDVLTGISSVDFTVAVNGSGFYHDRVAGDCIVKNDAGTIIESGECVVNVSKVHIKSRSQTSQHRTLDGLRGVDSSITTSSTNAEDTTNLFLNSFTATGVSLTNNANTNNLNDTYILHQTLYTHIKWGLTNQGKRYITAYNPVTREVMTMYQGSGVAGHQIPNPLGIKLDYIEVKNLDGTNDWNIFGNAFGVDKYMTYTTSAISTLSGYFPLSTEDYSIITGTINSTTNTNNNSYISYGFANSETKEIIQAQTSSTVDTPIYDKDGNYLFTADTWFGGQTYIFIVEKHNGKVVRIINKITSSTGSWYVNDYVRGFDKNIRLNLSDIEVTLVQYNNQIASTQDPTFNYAVDGSVLNLTNATFTYPKGKGSSGYLRSSDTFTGSIDFTGVSDGIKYVAKDELNNFSFYDEKPNIGLYNKVDADDNRLVLNDGSLWSTTGGELVANGDWSNGITGWTDVSSGTESVDASNVTGNTITLSRDAGGNTEMVSQLLTLDATKTTKVKIKLLSDTTGSFRIFLGTTSGGVEISNTVYSVGDIEFDINGYDSVYITLKPASAGTSVVGAVTSYELRATLDTELTTQVSFLQDKVLVASETPVDLLESDIPLEVVEGSLEVGGDVITNGEFKGKNACTAWVNFDGTTTPPTIRDSFNVSDVVRTATGRFKVYFETGMENQDYTMSSSNGDENIINNTIYSMS